MGLFFEIVDKRKGCAGGGVLAIAFWSYLDADWTAVFFKMP